MIDYGAVGGKFVPFNKDFSRACKEFAEHKQMDRFQANGGYIDFGLIPTYRRTDEQHQLDYEIKATFREASELLLTEKPFKVGDKVFLTDLWKHPFVVQALGYEYPGIHQLTGSCVGAGGGNNEFTILAVDCITRRDPEKIFIPGWLVTYGRSRFLLGDRGPGEGSLESYWFKAALQDGTPDAKYAGMPSFANSDMLTWSSSAEMKFSDGGRIDSSILTESRKHLIEQGFICRNAAEVRAAIRSLMPVGHGSMWGCENPTFQGEPKILVGRRDTSWSHKTTFQNWWYHPTLGHMFRYHNQWGKRAHTSQAEVCGSPPGGMWLNEKEVDDICRDNPGEVVAYKGIQGIDSDVISWGF